MLSVVIAPFRRGPVYARHADAVHDAASTMKIGVLAALHRSGIDLDESVPVVNRFASVAGGEFGCDPEEDSDPEPWQRLGTSVPLRWLAGRMVTHSSNLATNLCMERVGAGAVARTWEKAGATASASPRGIEDLAGREAGIRNVVTARDLVRLLGSLEPEVLAELEHNAYGIDLAAGLPEGTRLASKNGWITGVRNSAAVISPPDAEPYTLAVCYTGPLGSGADLGDPAAGLLARISARVWEFRHDIASA
jgi:beta-lactamase class A